MAKEKFKLFREEKRLWFETKGINPDEDKDGTNYHRTETSDGKIRWEKFHGGWCTITDTTEIIKLERLYIKEVEKS